MQPPTNIPLYHDWQFWAAIVAGLALILSQLPPIYLLLKRAKLDIELFSFMHITHRVGNPNVQLHLILSNVGGRDVRIKGSTIAIKRDGKDVALLPAQNYLQNPNDKTSVLFTSFSLKPKEDWAHSVNYLNYFSREDNKKYRSAESDIRADIYEKGNKLKNKDELVEADKKIFSVFIDMFNTSFIWRPGEYEVKITINTKPESAHLQKNYRFTLFESDSNELSKAKEDYRFGDGIYWDSGKHQGSIVQIAEV